MDEKVARLPKQQLGTDIGDLLQEEDTAEMTVENPKTGEPIIGADEQPWRITFAGPSHKRTIDLRNRLRREGFKKARMGQADDSIPTDEDERRNLALRCLGWSPIIRNGERFEYSQHNAEELFQTTWLLNQARIFLASDANFLRKGGIS